MDDYVINTSRTPAPAEFSPPELRVLIGTFSNPTTPNRNYIYSTAIKVVPMCHMIELMGREKHYNSPAPSVWMHWGMFEECNGFQHWTVERQHVFVCDEMKFKLQSTDERKKCLLQIWKCYLYKPVKIGLVCSLKEANKPNSTWSGTTEHLNNHTQYGSVFTCLCFQIISKLFRSVVLKLSVPCVMHSDIPSSN